jgi:hypothetical protein
MISNVVNQIYSIILNNMFVYEVREYQSQYGTQNREDHLSNVSYHTKAVALFNCHMHEKSVEQSPS